MFKKCFSILTALTIFSTYAIACWFTQENYENIYFAGVNYFYEHYYNSSNAVDKPISSAYYVNGPVDSNGNVSDWYKVSLPITPWIKVSPRIMSVNGELQTFNIRECKLYYKILPRNDADDSASSMNWRLAKHINKGSNPKWKLDFKSPVKLFGENVITKELIERNGDEINPGDGIIMVLYVADNGPQSTTNIAPITENSPEPWLIYPDKKEEPYMTRYSSYAAPSYVMRVVWNGKILKTGR